MSKAFGSALLRFANLYDRPAVNIFNAQGEYGDGESQPHGDPEDRHERATKTPFDQARALHPAKHRPG